jgi:hypothetical protein
MGGAAHTIRKGIHPVRGNRHKGNREMIFFPPDKPHKLVRDIFVRFLI